MYFPDDLWKIIKNYQIDYKKMTGGFSPGIGGSPTWCNFSKNNHKISVWTRNNKETMELKLHAIEITPNDEYYDVRYIHLYYGWVILKKLDDGVFNQRCSSFEFFPGYY